MPVLGLNLAVDPLWYFSGNRIEPKNFAFDERRARLNLFLQSPESYDCWIFGSSRVTLLDPASIRGQSCFNFSFSAGNIAEFTLLASYLKQLGHEPDVVIVGVDYGSLQAADLAIDLPNYVKENANPPTFMRPYLAWSVADMSWRTVTDDSPMPRYYDGQFAGKVRTDVESFQPPQTEDALENLVGSTTIDAETVSRFAALLSLFPSARKLAYVPPLSAWHMRSLQTNGQLPAYLDGLSRISDLVERMYDFAIPNPLTLDIHATYDGSHYYPWVNDQIGSALSGDPPPFGLEITEMSRNQISDLYDAKLSTFRCGPQKLETTVIQDTPEDRSARQEKGCPDIFDPHK
jgi:pimeloyl-ACP methyl ester carboxylesterase